MVTIYDVPAEELVDELADRLADRIEEPDWATYTKTGADRDLPPEQEDFWHVRAASLLRTVAVDGPVGVDRLATKYGGRARGTNRYQVRSPHTETGSRKIIRVALQQLEAVDLVETAKGEGRRITAEGRSFIDEAAGDVLESLDRPDLERYA